MTEQEKFIQSVIDGQIVTVDTGNPNRHLYTCEGRTLSPSGYATAKEYLVALESSKSEMGEDTTELTSYINNLP